MRGAKSTALFLRTASCNAACPCAALVTYPKSGPSSLGQLSVSDGNSDKRLRNIRAFRTGKKVDPLYVGGTQYAGAFMLVGLHLNDFWCVGNILLLSFCCVTHLYDLFFFLQFQTCLKILQQQCVKKIY